MLGYLDEGWLGQLSSILYQGIGEGNFRPDLDVTGTAKAMMLQLKGLGYQQKLDPDVLDGLLAHIARQTEYWVKRRPEHWATPGKPE